MTKLILTAKDATSALSSVLRVRAASPKVSNILQFNITRPASSVTPPEPEFNIDDCRLRATLNIVASNYSEGGVYYIKYEATLTIDVMYNGSPISSQSGTAEGLTGGSSSDDAHIIVQVPSWKFSYGTSEPDSEPKYDTVNIKYDDTNTWGTGGELVPTIEFTDNTGNGVTAGYSNVSGVWDTSATVNFDGKSPNSSNDPVALSDDVEVEEVSDTKETE